ncbi:MAG: class I SAM-dependent methyltransferase [Pseudolysinimonas sp.]
MSTPTSGSARAFDDGSAGDANYGRIGVDYARYRRPDPRVASRILDAIGDSRTVLNVGAGAGSYEPIDRELTAVEPSASMRAQRPVHLPPAVDAVAESLPFDDDSFDASMATFSVHQWSDLDRGLAELRRVTRGPVVILTCDPDQLERFWLAEYAPRVISTEAGRYPSISRLAEGLGGALQVDAVPVPLDCVDGFGEAYYGRPEALLDPGARLANSAWSFVDAATADGYVAALRVDLDSGEWDRRFGMLRTQPEFDGSLRLITAR